VNIKPYTYLEGSFTCYGSHLFTGCSVLRPYRAGSKPHKGKVKHWDKWISGEEAMKILRITSKTTLQKLRDEGKIRFSQPEKKLIFYDVDSLHEYLNKHVHKTF
jgi:hypothetical protein